MVIDWDYAISGGKIQRLPNNPKQAWAGKMTSAGFHEYLIFCHLFVQKAFSKGPLPTPDSSQGRPEASLRHGKETLGGISEFQFPPSRSLIYWHHLWEEKWSLLAALVRHREVRKEGEKNGGRQNSKSINTQVTCNEWTNKNSSQEGGRHPEMVMLKWKRWHFLFL